MNFANYDIREDKDKYRELQAKMKDLATFCADNKLPHFISIAVAANEGVPTYDVSARTGCAMGLEILSDTIPKHFSIHRGADVIIGDALPEIDFS